MIYDPSVSFQLDMQATTIAVLEERIAKALTYLNGCSDSIGYGLSPLGVIEVSNILEGYDDDLGTPGPVE